MRALCNAAILATLVTVLASPALNNTAPQGTDEGTKWMGWGMETKTILVDEYTAGYIDGSTHTCGVASGLLVPTTKYSRSQDMPNVRCMHTVRKFSKRADYYVFVLDEFYTKYPQDRHIPARFVLRRLYDGNDISIERLNELAKAGALQISQGD